MVEPKHQALAQELIRFLMGTQRPATPLSMHDTMQALVIATACTAATVAEHMPHESHQPFVDALTSQIRALTHLNITRDCVQIHHTAGHG